MESTNTVVSTELLTRVENIENNLLQLNNTSMFLLVFLVCVLVIFVLYKVLDNFISF